MPDKSRLYRDFLALALLALVIFLSLAIVSYDPADAVPTPVAPLNLIHQVDPLAYPPNLRLHNMCGYFGALAADALLNWFGVGAYYVVLSLGVFTYHLLRRREIDSPALRMLGWIASLAGVTTIAAIGFPSFAPGPVIGSGGYLGALGKAAALAHFATVGGIILASSVTLGGLLLCTDYALIETAVFLYKIACLPRMKANADVEEAKSSPLSKRS